MFKSLILVSLFSLFVCNAEYSQSRVSTLAFSIADTSKSELEQSEAIYNWISSNISYDVKSFIKHSPKNYSPEQTIKKKKGVCYEYAGLMTAMCNSLGIETYTVEGYSKGFGYYPNQSFTRANHSWNVFMADSVWIIADPTWGSGYLEYKPKTISNVINKIFKNSYLKNKIYFHKYSNRKYFHIPADQFVITHYPLSPEWLFDNNPPSYISFESAFTDSSTIAIDFKNNIETLRNKSPEYFRINEGESGLTQNSNNHFDKSFAILNSIQNFNPEKEITPENVFQYESMDKKCAGIIQDLNKQQIIVDSLNDIRMKSLKMLASKHSKAVNSVIKNTHSAKKGFKKNMKSNTKKEKVLYSKISAINTRISLLEKTHIKKNNKKLPLITDPDQDRDIKLKLADLELQQPHYEFQMDSIQFDLKTYIEIDARLNDSIIVVNELLNKRFITLKNILTKNKEVEIKAQSDTLWNLFIQSRFITARKSMNNDNIDSLKNVFSNNIKIWGQLLKEEQELLRNAYKTFHYPEAIFDAYENSLKNSVTFYKYQIDFNQKLLSHNGLQRGLLVENRSVLKKLKKNAVKEYHTFENWFKLTVELQKSDYQNERKIISLMKKVAIEKDKMTVNNLNKFHNNLINTKQK